jgi:hypothetical protein
MGLAHFTNVTTAFSIWEPIFKSLFEVQITLPPLVSNNLPNVQGILLENTTSFPLPTYPKFDTKDQRFKYSTRAFPGLPGQTHLTDQTIKFNLNESVQVIQNQTNVPYGRIPVFRAIKDWYDLVWNNETGQLNYKGNLVGTVICDQHDKEGLVIRRVIWHNAFITGFTGWEDIDWSNVSDIAELSATFSLDFWEDFYY